MEAIIIEMIMDPLIIIAVLDILNTLRLLEQVQGLGQVQDHIHLKENAKTV
jgi:hypothetical protein